jgi:hypothetical protein
MKPSWQDVLQKASYEFLGLEGHAFPLAVTAVLITKGHPTIIDIENSVVGDSDTMKVAIVQDLVYMNYGRFTIHHPRSLPNRLWNRKVCTITT